MRLLEILLILLTLSGVFVTLATSARHKLAISLAGLILAVLVIHAFLEGLHWQMGPAYVAAVLEAALLFLQRRMKRRWMRYLFSACILFLVFAGCTCSMYLPMFQLPAPTGSYAIGTRIIPLVNDHPHDLSSAGPDGKRALMIQLWYPALPSHAPRAPYRILSETTPLSSYQSSIWTHARWSAPFAGNQAFPLLLLNPAWNGRRTYYMYLVEDLVSHGYIVAGIDHTGNSGPTAFPDGHISQPLQDPDLDFGNRTYAELNAYGARQQAVQVEDDRFVLDQLLRWNQDVSSFYYHRFDIDRIGAFGHSFGGSVSAEDCLEDPRFKAAFDMDGSFWGPVQKDGIARPLMMIEEDYTQYTPQQLQQDRSAANDHQFDMSDDVTMSWSNGYRVVLHGSSHSSYTDRSLFSPLRQYSGVGTIAGRREDAMIRSYALAFFDKALKGIDSPLLNPDNKTYPEATLTVLHRPEHIPTI